MRAAMWGAWLGLMVMGSVAEAQWWWGGGAISAAQARQDGIADMVRAKGQFDKDTAEAAVTRAQATRDEADARLQATQDFFNMRRVNQQYQQEQVNRRHVDVSVLNRRAQDALPRRLPPSVFDSTSGKISWIRQFNAPEFEADRKALDELFVKWAEDRQGLESPTFPDIAAALNDMHSKLRKQINAMDTASYIAAMRFIEALRFEAQFPPGT